MTSHPVDTHVGQRLRFAREQHGFTQQALAAKLGLTFQQIQKYERGINRIAASRLYQLSEILSCPVAWFFEGLESEQTAQKYDPLPPEMYKLLADYKKLPEPMQKPLRVFIKNCARAGG